MSTCTSLNLIGSAGRCYTFKKMILERPRLSRVWLASCGNEEFVLKEMPRSIFLNFTENIRPRLPQMHHIRAPIDTIQCQRICVYEYLDDDFLAIVKKNVPSRACKEVLHATLEGIAELHDRNIVHLDIKPDNILVNLCHADQDTVIEKVQVSDLENAAHLPKPRCIKGLLAGNENWRSPEGHFKGELYKPTDLYSSGSTCIYAMLGRVILGPDDDFRLHESKGALPALIRLQRQVSYFGERDGLNGLMKHVGDEEISCEILGMLWEDREIEDIPYIPFSEWPDVDSTFKDLIPRSEQSGSSAASYSSSGFEASLVQGC